MSEVTWVWRRRRRRRKRWNLWGKRKDWV